jgi:hypothetical protein
MYLSDFTESLKNESPNKGLDPILQSLWYAGKGDWKRAHDIAQDIHTADGSWVHAYLHRLEGDVGNAAYWYQKAKKPLPTISVEKEWEEVVLFFLERTAPISK